MKKAMAVFFALVVLSTAQLTAFAHGHHGNGGRVAQNRYYYTCPYNDCIVATNHTHNGVHYYAHHDADGHAQCVSGSTGNNGYHRSGGSGYHH